MSVLFMFITCLLSGIFCVFLIEKIKIKEKLKKFDDKNSGPVYELIKSLLILALFIGSFGGVFSSLVIYDYIIKGQYKDALYCFIVAFISGIIIGFLHDSDN